MKVILRQDVEKLGNAGDVVKVAPGYGRNYLIPRKIAIEATPGNLKIIEIERLANARRDQREQKGASLVARELEKLTVTIRRKAGESGTLYGSVTGIDIADFLITHKIDIDKRKIQLEEPIKSVGEFQVPIRLHREVTPPAPALLAGKVEERLFLGTHYRHYVRVGDAIVMVDGAEPVPEGPVSVIIPPETALSPRTLLTPVFRLLNSGFLFAIAAEIPFRLSVFVINGIHDDERHEF